MRTLFGPVVAVRLAAGGYLAYWAAEVHAFDAVRARLERVLGSMGEESVRASGTSSGASGPDPSDWSTTSRSDAAPFSSRHACVTLDR